MLSDRCLSCLSVCNVGVLWPNGWMDPAPPPQKGEQSLQFSAHVYGGQTAGWIKMPLGREEGLNPSNIVLNGNQAHPCKRGTAAPLFSAHVYCGHGRPSQLPVLLSSCYLRQRGYVIVVVCLSVC